MGATSQYRADTASLWCRCLCQSFMYTSASFGLFQFTNMFSALLTSAAPV